MKLKYRGVLFDLDGTLLDTLQDLCDSANRVLAARGWPIHPRESYRWFVGEGAHTLIERALPAEHRQPDIVAAVLRDYRKDYAQHWNVATRPYPGIPELLAGLQAGGVALGVLSNKPHPMTVKCIQGYFPGVPFGAILGQRDEVARKPNPAGAHEAAKLMGVDSAAVLYVGDTGVDMATARAAGMFALGAAWGFRPETELREHGAQAIIHHPAGVLRALAG
jgi:phosphoglycolate phosphatase